MHRRTVRSRLGRRIHLFCKRAILQGRFEMKSFVFGWLFALSLLANHVGCCSIRMVGGGCETGACGGLGCDGIASFGSLRSRIADRIRSTNCSSGCGEIYWDEHINEPPVCDPCGCNGEFECGSCRSCPTALGRLRNLWNYQRYMPSSCGECSSCGINPVQGNSSSCSTCAGNTHAENGTSGYSVAPTQTVTSRPASGASGTRVPTPASKPKLEREPSVAPTPVPDANAVYRSNAPAERYSIGSGVPQEAKRTIAKPVVANTKQSLQGKPRLVTNPR